MKNLIVKLFIILIIIFNFTGCYTLWKNYWYEGIPINNSSTFKEYEYIYIYIISKL